MSANHTGNRAGVEELTHDAYGVHFSVEGGGRTVTARRRDGALIDTAPVEDPVYDDDHLAEIAHGWIAERVGATIPDPVHCDACGTPIDVVMVNSNPRDALEVTFCGGYGMYIDPTITDTPTATICKSCADELCEQNPWIAALLDEAE